MDSLLDKFQIIGSNIAQYVDRTMINQILKIVGVILVIAYACVLLKLRSIEEKIFIVKDWIDNLEYICLNPYLNQSQLDKKVKKDGKPLKDELERLKLERQFLLDKIPLIGWFKK